jgi:hypothetical protein
MLDKIGKGALVAVLSTVPFAAGAATMNFTAVLQELNDTGVSGTANFSFDDMANTLTTNVNVSGLAPNTLHPQHIHGSFQLAGCTAFAPSSSPIAGTCLNGDTAAESGIPTLAANDIDGDGFLETVEGAPAYGPIILNLADASAGRGGLPGSFPMSDGDGNLSFSETYNLATTDLLFDPLNGIEHEAGDLFPLFKRVYVIHGVFVNNDQPAVENDMFEVQGPINAFVTLLPAAAGEITMSPSPIPLPAAGWLLVAALGGLGGLSRMRRRPA